LRRTSSSEALIVASPAAQPGTGQAANRTEPDPFAAKPFASGVPNARAKDGYRCSVLPSD
jgi:hypothetical protein